MWTGCFIDTFWGRFQVEVLFTTELPEYGPQPLVEETVSPHLSTWTSPNRRVNEKESISKEIKALI